MRALTQATATIVCLIATMAVSGAAPAAADQVVTVPVVPGDPVASGDALLETMASINDASFSKRYLVRLEAGVYDVGTTPLQMKEWVSLEGAGVEATLLRGVGEEGTGTPTRGVVNGADKSEIRRLKIAARKGESNVGIFNDAAGFVMTQLEISVFEGVRCRGIFMNGAAWPYIQHVDITVECKEYTSGITTKNGVRPTILDTTITSKGSPQELDNVGMWLSSSAMPHRFERVSITAGDSSNPGVGIVLSNVGGTSNWLEIAHSRVNANGGVAIKNFEIPVSLAIRHSDLVNCRIGYQDESTGVNYVQLHHANLCGSQNVIETVASGWIRMGLSQLDGGPIASAGFSTITCAGVYDESFTFFPSTCP